MSKIRETCPTCKGACERISESFRACCECKTPINNLIAVDYEKIQAKSTRRKKALKQLNRAVTEWQRLAMQRGHAKDSELTFPGGSKLKFNPVPGEQEDWEGSQIIGEKESKE